MPYSYFFLNNAVSSCNLEEFGESLHLLQDYHSHTLQGFGPLVGHLFAGSAPDIPANNLNLYNQMLRATKDAMKLFKENVHALNNQIHEYYTRGINVKFRTKTAIVILVIGSIIGCSIFISSEKHELEKKLRERIDGVYHAYKERDFKKFLGFCTSDYVKNEDRKKMIIQLEKGYPVLLDYDIKEINITGDKARVKIILKVILHSAEDVSESFDYWVFRDNDWYLYDFGKIK